MATIIEKTSIHLHGDHSTCILSQKGLNRSLPTDDVPITAAALPQCSRWWPNIIFPMTVAKSKITNDRVTNFESHCT